MLSTKTSCCFSFFFFFFFIFRVSFLFLQLTPRVLYIHHTVHTAEQNLKQSWKIKQEPQSKNTVTELEDAVSSEPLLNAVFFSFDATKVSLMHAL